MRLKPPKIPENDDRRRMLNLRESVLKKLWSVSAGLSAGLLVVLGHQIAPVVLPSIAAGLSPNILLSLLGLSVLVNACLLILLWLSAHEARLTLKNGLFWDRRKNPHCPACKIPLSGFGKRATYNFENSANCVQCGTVFNLDKASPP
jgi:hypothetical protein